MVLSTVCCPDARGRSFWRWSWTTKNESMVKGVYPVFVNGRKTSHFDCLLLKCNLKNHYQICNPSLSIFLNLHGSWNYNDGPPENVRGKKWKLNKKVEFSSWSQKDFLTCWFFLNQNGLDGILTFINGSPMTISIMLISFQLLIIQNFFLLHL